MVLFGPTKILRTEIKKKRDKYLADNKLIGGLTIFEGVFVYSTCNLYVQYSLKNIDTRSLKIQFSRKTVISLSRRPLCK